MRPGSRAAHNNGAYLLLVALYTNTLHRIETDPQALWVRPGSRAAQERASYDASFGPFYRIEQLLISTKPSEGCVRVYVCGWVGVDGFGCVWRCRCVCGCGRVWV